MSTKTWDQLTDDDHRLPVSELVTRYGFSKHYAYKMARQDRPRRRLAIRLVQLDDKVWEWLTDQYEPVTTSETARAVDATVQVARASLARCEKQGWSKNLGGHPFLWVAMDRT